MTVTRRPLLPLLLTAGMLSSVLAEAPVDWDEAKRFWAFQGPKAACVPPVVDQREWASHPIDHFVLAGLEREKLLPSERAEPEVLLRRLSMLLTGLPVSDSLAERFFEDSGHPNAVDRLSDRLLGGYALGERFASEWLTLARYGEDQAHQVGADTAYFYPNAHLYRQWVIDSFNQDLPYDEFIRLQLAADRMEGGESQLEALGFLGLGPKYYNRGRLEVMADEWEDRVDTVTRAFLGLTVACARCHDHKYDPITTEDYHALAGVFASTAMENKPLPGYVPSEEKEEGDKKKKGPKPEETMHIVKDDKVQDLPVFIRGNVETKGKVVPRRFLSILQKPDAQPFHEGSGRSELAAAIADRENPLTARVMVNRLWAMVYGHPLVGTPSNFGKLGMRPTHPELLDTLAVAFQAHWSSKKLLKDMVSSASFLQGSVATPSAAKSDPGNAWLSRMNRRKLSIEMWRDSLLVLADQFDPAGGPSMELSDPANFRRTVYGRVSRLDLNDMLEQFDYPDPNIHADSRSETTTTTQKLFLLNHPLVINLSTRMAERVDARDESLSDKVNGIHRRFFGREATTAEMEEALGFLKDPGVDDWARYLQVLRCSNQMLFVE